MVTVIDHAIAIPTRPATVWEQIREIAQNPIWQANCEQVQFLTTAHRGRGTRWRSTGSRGKEQVIEITAWYDGLGYEYRIVDGVPFSSNRGRIRLQDSPEGTIVQWTFSYELTGFMSGLRNTLSIRGGIDNNIVDGLRNLYTHIKNLKADETFIPEESKSYLKLAPDVSARSQYQPRYPSVLDSKVPKAAPISQAPTLQAQEMASLPIIEEPPIADDDTHPNQAIEPAAEIFAPKSVQSDSFVPKTVQAEALPSFDEPIIEEETVASPKPALSDTVPQISIPPVEETSSPAIESLTLGRDVNKMDTAKISVFEIFGLDKPSETEKVLTITEKPADPAPLAFSDPTPIKPDIEPEAPRRRGLRAALRRKLTNVRLPK